MSSTTPLMVPRDQLVRVAGMNATLKGVIKSSAPPLGALLLSLVDVQGILPLDVVTAIVAIAPLFFVPVPQPAARGVTGTGLRSVLHGLRDGFRYVWEWPGLRGLVGTAALQPLGTQPLAAFLPLLVTQHFGGGAPQLALLTSAYGIGGIAGGVLLSAWGGLKRNMATNIAGVLSLFLGCLLVASAPPNALWLAVTGWVVIGMAGSATNSGKSATIQTVVRPEMLGRYKGINRSMNRAVVPLALALTTPIVVQWGVRALWYFCPATILATALLRRFVPAIYHIEDHPDVGEPADQAAGGQDTQPQAVG